MVSLFFKHPRGFLLLLEILYDLPPRSLIIRLFLIFCFNLVQSHHISSIPPHSACSLCLSAFACAIPFAEKMSLPFWSSVNHHFLKVALLENNMPLLCCLNHSTNAHEFDWHQLPHYIVSSQWAETICSLLFP